VSLNHHAAIEMLIEDAIKTDSDAFTFSYHANGGGTRPAENQVARGLDPSSSVYGDRPIQSKLRHCHQDF
jgi:hypothetical protein